MIESAVQNYEVYNPVDPNCPVCHMFNDVFKTYSFQREMEIPKEVGRGYCKRIIIKPSMEITVSDVTVNENITLGGGMSYHSYGLAFCLGDVFHWNLEGDKKEYVMENGESYVFNGMDGIGICGYNSGQRFLGLSIMLDPETIGNFFYHMGKERFSTRLTYGNSDFYKIKFSPRVRMILNDMIHCRYQGNIKRIFLEGKILELVAVFFNELLFEKEEEKPSAVNLSSTDIMALHEAKRILDGNLVSPPTIGKLAKMVLLNEYKLKTGFKELFEMPVHAYLIDKRLEWARLLMDDQKLRVTETALQVGYSDASHFAEKFRKKFGINPSEYLKK